MEHVWTYEGRKREGQLPLLPDHCAVVFDEGHLLESAAQKALTYKLKHDRIRGASLLDCLRTRFVNLWPLRIDEAIERSETLFELLARQSIVDSPAPIASRSTYNDRCYRKSHVPQSA